MPYTIRVVQDMPPTVELNAPGDTSLPANGMLQVDGTASDDYGVTKIALHMQVQDGPTLQPRMYRGGMSFRQPDGRYPDSLEYKDFVELDKLKQASGLVFSPVPGMKIKYWLEATDNCEYPAPQVGRSKEFTIAIEPPQKDDAKRQQDRNQVQKDQQQHEQQQDQKLSQQKSDDQKQQRSEPEKSQQGDQQKQKQDGREQQPGEQSKTQQGEGQQQSQDGQNKNEGELQRKAEDLKRWTRKTAQTSKKTTNPVKPK